MSNKPEYKLQKESRIQPQAVEVEESVIGSMLMEMEACSVALTVLKPVDFYNPVNRMVFEIISQLYQDGQHIDMMMVEGYLRKTGRFDDLPIDYLPAIIRSVISTANTDYYCQIIKEKSVARKFIQTFERLIDQVSQPGSDIADILMDGESFVYEALTGESTTKMQKIQSVVQSAMDEIEAIQGSPDGITGMASGLPYDQITSGFQRQKMYVIAGRPGHGKTAFMLQNIKEIAEGGHRCGVISLEMGAMSLGTRLILAEANVNSQKARTGRLSSEELEQCREATKTLKSLGVVIDDTTDITPSLLRIKARMMKQVHKIDLLAVDYIQLMRSDNDKQSREQEVSEISRTCKLLSKDLDMPVIVLAQLNRKLEDRRGFGKRPQNGDLRESGAIEQDADCVMMLFRPEEYGIEAYEDGTSTENIAEVIITKHRDGPTGLKKLMFDKETGRFKKLHIEPPISSHSGDKTEYAWWKQ